MSGQGLELPTSREQRDSIRPGRYSDSLKLWTPGTHSSRAALPHQEVDFPRGAAVYTPARMEVHK